MDCQGNLERTWKVKEKSGNLKIMAMAGSLKKIIYSVQEGKGCTFSWDSLSPSPITLGATLKGNNLLRICSLGEQILSFKSNPQI